MMTLGQRSIVPESNRVVDAELIHEGKVWVEVSSEEVDRLVQAQMPDRRDLPSSPPPEDQAADFIKKGIFHPRTQAQANAKAELDRIHYIETAEVYVRRILL